MKNQVLTDKKCPDCNYPLHFLTIAGKYDCPRCGWDGSMIDIELHEKFGRVIRRWKYEINNRPPL
jgi:uncharacterized Zn finger protein (UPF0148 family)